MEKVTYKNVKEKILYIAYRWAWTRACVLPDGPGFRKVVDYDGRRFLIVEVQKHREIYEIRDDGTQYLGGGYTRAQTTNIIVEFCAGEYDPKTRVIHFAELDDRGVLEFEKARIGGAAR